MDLEGVLELFEQQLEQRMRAFLLVLKLMLILLRVKDLDWECLSSTGVGRFVGHLRH